MAGFQANGPIPPNQALSLVPDTLLQNSNIRLRLDKLQSQPDGWQSCRIEREEAGSMPAGDGHQEIQVLWNCVSANAWQTRVQFQNWLIGYTYLTQQPGANQQVNLHPSRFSRTIPAQCPEPGWEHCYVTRFDNKDTGGYWAKARHVGQEVRNADGPITNADGSKLTVFPEWPAAFERENVGTAAGIAAQQAALAAGAAAGGIVPSAGAANQAAFLANSPDGCPQYLVTYKPRRFAIRTDAEVDALAPQFPNTPAELLRCVERDVKQALTSQPLPKGSVRFLDLLDNGGRPVPIPDNGCFVLTPTESLTYTLWDWPGFPFKALAACMGKTNALPFDGAPGAPTYAAGTLLMQAPQRQVYQAQNGQWLAKITLEFLHRPLTADLAGNQGGGWNSLLGPDGLWHPAGIFLNQPLPAGNPLVNLFANLPGWLQNRFGPAAPVVGLPLFSPANYNDLFAVDNLVPVSLT